ncbi:MAG: DUF2358 domain-containing protein [Synechococcales cyanobacterium RM1_1_8]|nr:DUF2358 domain-containing protein [Synechococcales cyanobacterium RM1_1_8]
MADLLALIRADYARFPADQRYDLYAEDVYFKDPMTEFRGVQRYRDMIGFIQRWFQQPQLDLHDIQQQGDRITTRWTLAWTTPLPWRPRLAIPGWTEMQLNGEGKICSHIDHWEISRWSVVQQLWRSP